MINFSMSVGVTHLRLLNQLLKIGFEGGEKF